MLRVAKPAFPPPDPHLFGHADLGQRRFRLFFDEFMFLNCEFVRDWWGDY